MPPKTVTGADGKQYVLLSDGTQIPADEMQEPKVSAGEGFAHRAYSVLSNPEVLGGVAGLLGPETGGLSLAIPAGVGAATSVGRDLLRGERDPKTLLSDAALHGGLNAIPGAVGGLTRVMTGAKAGAGMALDAAENLPKVGGYIKGLRAATGMGSAAAPAMTKGASDLVGATLPFGEKVLSPEGLKYLMEESGKLATKGKAFGDPQYDALQQLITTVKSHLAANPSDLDLASKAYIPVQTAAQQAAATAAKYGSRISNSLRAMLGLSSATYDQAK